jgi:hypothetical protein
MQLTTTDEHRWTRMDQAGDTNYTNLHESALRVGKKISYDGAAGKVLDNPEANTLLSRTCRERWTLIRVHLYYYA